MHAIRTCTLCVLAVTCHVHAGTLVINHNLSFVPDGLFGDYSATVFQDAAATDFTSVWFDYDGLDLLVVQWNIDEGSDWYVVNEGDEFSLATIGSGQFAVLLEACVAGPPVEVPSGEFYLGVATGLGFGDREVFGWVRMKSEAGVLEMVRNVIAYDCDGIIVGSPADVTGDGVFDVDDLLAVLAGWGVCPGCPADLDGSGAVDVDDLLAVLEHWS